MTSEASYDPDVWERIFKSRAWGKYPAENLIRFIARNFFAVPERSSIRILEVGCGPGANLWFLAREGFEVHGIDASSAAIDLARQRLEEECPGWQGRLTVGDMTCLPYEDDFFDAVIDVEAVYCNPFEQAQKIYAEMARVTKPGGKLFSRTFARGSSGDETGKKIGRDAWLVAEGPLAGKGFSRFTRHEDINELYRGFVIDSIDFIHESHYNQSWIVKEWIIVGVKPVTKDERA